MGTGFIARQFTRTFHNRQGLRVEKVLTRRDLNQVNDFPQADALTNALDDLLESCDVVVECSGDAIYASDVVSGAFAAERPVVTMNSEFHVTAGSYFVGKGRLTESEGDQPGALAALHRFVTEMGFRPLVYGNLKGFLNHNPTRKEMERWAAKQGISLAMNTAFTDGTKVQIEQALVANAFGATIAQTGMLGPREEDFEAAGAKLASHAHRLDQPISDYVVSTRAPHGVFIVADHDNADPAALKYFKLGDGPTYLLLRPNIFVHLELPRTIRQLLRTGEQLLDNSPNPTIGIAALTKQPVKSGARIETAIGSFEFRGTAIRIRDFPGHVPIGLLQDAVIVRDLEPEQMVMIDDVELPQTTALRAWQSIHDRVTKAGP